MKKHQRKKHRRTDEYQYQTLIHYRNWLHTKVASTNHQLYVLGISLQQSRMVHGYQVSIDKDKAAKTAAFYLERLLRKLIGRKGCEAALKLIFVEGGSHTGKLLHIHVIIECPADKESELNHIKDQIRVDWMDDHVWIQKAYDPERLVNYFTKEGTDSICLEYLDFGNGNGGLPSNGAAPPPKQIFKQPFERRKRQPPRRQNYNKCTPVKTYKGDELRKLARSYGHSVSIANLAAESSPNGRLNNYWVTPRAPTKANHKSEAIRISSIAKNKDLAAEITSALRHSSYLPARRYS